MARLTTSPTIDRDDPTQLEAGRAIVVQYLEEAHATEAALVTTLQAHITMTPTGDYRALLDRHLGETRQQARAIEPSTRVTVPGTTAQGEVIRLGRAVDQATQSVAATVLVDAGTDSLRPGQVVSASVALQPNGTPQWRLPAGSVVRHAGQSWVFVRRPDGFVARPVTVIAEVPSATSVRAGLAPEDRVASRGILTLLAELTEVYGG